MTQRGLLMKTEILLSLLIALLVAVAAAAGVFYRTPEPHASYVTVRGQHAISQGSGLYRYDPVAVAREGVVWDAINLALGVPLLVAASLLVRRGSLRGRLLLAGLAFYFFYVYLQYAVMLAFNPLFLVYVAIFALSSLLLAIDLSHIDVRHLPEHITERFPRRLFIGFSFTLSGALLLMWLGRIIPIMKSGLFPPELAGMTTLVTQAMDLGMVVPLAISAGVLLMRRSPWGYLLAGIALTFGLMMFITIPAWIAVPLIQDGTINAAEASPFLLLCAVGLVLTWRFLRGVRE